jgi:hypothetical protein
MVETNTNLNILDNNFNPSTRGLSTLQSEGSSGGPRFVFKSNSYFICSHNSYQYQNGNNVQYGPYFDNYISQLLSQALQM